MIILDSVAEKQVAAFLAGFPPRCHTTARRLAAEVCEHLPGLVQNISLLLNSLFKCQLDARTQGFYMFSTTG